MAFQYQMLAQQLAQKIQQGELALGQRLNSLRHFAQLNDISLNTAKSCYELLEAQGLIYVKPKVGYFSKNNNWKWSKPLYLIIQTLCRCHEK